MKKFVRVVSEIYKKALKVQIFKEVALIQVVGAGVFFRRANVLLAKADDETRKEGRK